MLRTRPYLAGLTIAGLIAGWPLAGDVLAQMRRISAARHRLAAWMWTDLVAWECRKRSEIGARAGKSRRARGAGCRVQVLGARAVEGDFGFCVMGGSIRLHQR